MVTAAGARSTPEPDRPGGERARLPWPLPALATWLAGWALFAGLGLAGVAPIVAVPAAVVLGAASAVVWGSTRWRRAFIALGFPLSLAASGVAGALPAWSWLLPLAVLALVYPVNAWRDAPLFPTPTGALDGLSRLAPLGAQARVLDAGCGLGDGLRALRRSYPDARLEGLEWSWPLRLLAALRCRDAQVRRGDLWAADWSAFELVYLFQRPESMPRALAKAARELRPGAWLASLEFDVPGVAPTRSLACADGRTVWLYRAPLALKARAASRR